MLFRSHIENKILSLEGQEQTKREWRDLNARADVSGIPRANRHALFLTLEGTEAEEKNFHAVGWSRIAKVLEEFAEKAQPPVVRLFARHYAEALRKLVALRAVFEEIAHVQNSVQ